MIPVGYMYKAVSECPDWLKSSVVRDVFSVSSCISSDFHDDWINFWRHNGYWFYDSPEVMEALSLDHSFPLTGMTLFFYFCYEQQWDDVDDEWIDVVPESSFATDVVIPGESVLHGYDIVSFSAQNSAECSPLSCNHMAEEIEVSEHCLLAAFEDAKTMVETSRFKGCEPGPYRIFEVHTVTPPNNPIQQMHSQATQ